ncbi:MAG: hypothetical protein K2P51_01640 [Rhabdochlamydiaceae bacterium]|nr:hypothetical protein [Rhabdochlamydiaceae bacterium]
MINYLVGAGTSVACAAGTVAAYSAAKNAALNATTAVALNAIGYWALTFSLGAMTLMSLSACQADKKEMNIPDYLLEVVLAPVTVCMMLFLMVFYGSQGGVGPSKSNA